VSVEVKQFWNDIATRSSETLQARYWNPVSCLFKNGYPEARDERFHYWWQAHAMDTLIDAFERCGEPIYLLRAEQLLQGIFKRNGGKMTNDFYDDMQWLALALLRLYDVTKKANYLEHVQTLWQDIQTGWNEHCGGGIAWRKPQLDYKNTPANGPAVILAARLYQRLQNECDLETAQKIYDWLQAYLLDPDTGFVWDGMNRQGDFKIDKDWKFTYCQGVVVGAGLELYRATKDKSYLQQAQRTARAGLEVLCDEDGILPDEGGGDGGLFKGILVRYLTLLQLEQPDSVVFKVLQTNGEALVALQSPLAGTSWRVKANDPVELSSALSGVMLSEALAKIDRAKIDRAGILAPKTA
jgi:predicted alpha-1,6-mannanase (GH76 family)